MKTAFILAGLVLGLITGCASSPDPKPGLDQLLVLYKENRPKFVVQKIKMIQASSCRRAATLHREAKARVKAAEMSPENNDVLIAVQRELDQAEKECRKR